MFYEEQFSFINDDISIMIDSLINNNMMRDHILFLGSVVGLWLAHWTPVEWSGEKLRVERIAGAPKHQRLETEPAKPMKRQILPMGGCTDSNRLVQMITP